MSRRKLAAGNWKMNGDRAALAEVRALVAAHPSPECEVLICPPATLVAAMAGATQGSAIRVGGQDCHPKAAGAHTGDVSAAMLADCGAGAVIHSGLSGQDGKQKRRNERKDSQRGGTHSFFSQIGREPRNAVAGPHNEGPSGAYRQPYMRCNYFLSGPPCVPRHHTPRLARSW